MPNYQRLLKIPTQSCFLFGLRGSGKSTWCREHFPDALWVDLLDEGLYQELLIDPKNLGMQLKALKPKSTVVIDEVQRLPYLLNEVHRFIEEKKLRFILTGSSTRKLKRAGVNLLAGRALSLHLYPLTPWELGSDFNIHRVLEMGSLPIILASENVDQVLKSYVQLYLREEIQAEALARNLQGFARFLNIAALYNAQVCNISSLAREAGIGRATVSDYFSILEDTHMGFYLPSYEAKLRVRERSAPKWIWSDPGIVRSLKKYSGPVQQEKKGPLFESWLISCVRAWNSYNNEPWHTLSYWSALENKDMEVDLILENQKGITAIEIKSSERFRPEMLKGLRAFKENKKVKMALLVYLGDKILESDEGIRILPLDVFLKELNSGSLVS